jgi:hypothetical protein
MMSRNSCLLLMLPLAAALASLTAASAAAIVAIRGPSSSEHRCPDQLGLTHQSLNDSLVNITFEPAVKNQIVLIADGQPENLTIIIQRRAHAVGTLCVYLKLNIANSEPPPSIGVQGLPLLVVEETVGENRSLDDVTIDYGFRFELSGTRLGRARLLVTAWEQRPTNDVSETTIAATELPVSQVDSNFHLRVITFDWKRRHRPYS